MARSHHANTYSRLTAAIAQTQCAHYALEEAEYKSALQYIGEAEKELSEARKAIEPEITGTFKTQRSRRKNDDCNQGE